MRAVVASLAVLLVARTASAANVHEYPEQGSEPLARGGAWVARATDPIAIARNPAGLAGQRAAIVVGYDLALRHMCFSRLKAANDPTEDSGVYPRVCDDGIPVPAGFVAAAVPISTRLAVGVGVVTPSGVPRISFPMFVNGTPAPQRYLLIEATTLMAIPTVAAAYELAPGLRAGVAVGWGIAWVRTAAAAPSYLTGAIRPGEGDAKVEVTALDAFVPRGTLGVHWSASSAVEVGASAMWSDPIDAAGDARTQANAFTSRAASGDTSRVVHGDTSRRDCGRPATTACGEGGNARLVVPLPASATLGVRVRFPRVRGGTVRDPLSDEHGDVELDTTWTGNAAVDRIGVRFPPGIPVAGTAGTFAQNADSERRYRDVVGLRAGGDVVVIPGRLAVRGGAFVEPRAAVPGYAGLEALAGRRLGFSAGATVRLGAVDLSLAYLRVFVGDLVSGQGGISAAAGAAPHRTPWPVSLGRIESSLDVVHLGLAFRL